MDLHIRWMIRTDLQEVLDIEKCSFKEAWTEQDFKDCLKQRNAVGMVCETDEGKVLGYMIYLLFKGKLELMNFAVHPDYRYQGVGTALINKLKKKLSINRRKHLILLVNEHNLDAQLFFKKKGFIATKIEKRPYHTGESDGIVFEYEVFAKDDWSPRNRIKEYMKDV